MTGSSSKFFLIASVASCALAPSIVFGQIVISEFLYDATGSDTDQEFVELFNAGTSAVDLTQWKINDGSNHTLNVPPKNGSTGSIVLAPGAYLLLVDDAAAFIPLHSGITVSIIDTVLSLPNTAGAISLVNEEGATVDSVSYTKDHGGAGDGNSLIRTSVSGRTFTSGTPTPGTGSLSASRGSSSSDTGTNQTVQTTQTANSEERLSASSVEPPETQLFADGGSDRAVIVGADVQFSGRAYNRKKEIVTNARLVWNFGDGSTAEGAKVFHHYSYPGRYVVVLDIAESENPVSDQIIVTAEKAQMTFSVIPDGSVSIENHSGRTLDLSSWIVREQNRNFALPDHSLVLPGATMHISAQTLGFSGDVTVELMYPNGIVALRAGESTESTPTSIEPQSVSETQTVTADSSSNSESVSSKRGSSPTPESADESDVSPGEISADLEETGSSTQVAAASAGGSRWWLGAIAIAVLAGGALFAAQRFKKKEWDIEEM